MTDTPCSQTDPNLWFAEPGTIKSAEAKRICFQQCPVLNKCQEIALLEGIPYGVWGGLDEKDRARMWHRMEGGKPSGFLDSIDAQLRPLMMRRRQTERDDAA